eukprot:9392836-Ditylum_brightwellii.AAC.1
MDRNKQNKHLVCNNVDNVDDGVDNDSVGNCDNDCVDDGADDADKYHVHLSQVANWCCADRNKRNKHLLCYKDDDVDNVDYCADNDSVGNGNDDCVDDVSDCADKYLAHLSQVADCY